MQSLEVSGAARPL